TAIALTALLVFFFMNSGTDATETNVNVATAATPIPTVPTPIVLQQATPLPQQPIIIQQPPAATTQTAPIIVSPPAGTTSAPATNPANDDSAIESRVNKALNDDTEVSSLGITVTVSGGKAMLNGLVKTPEQKARAEQTAKAVRGVKSVDNKIIIEGQ
ncbi:MAG: BON domain-containing protein, partial [Acidobacteria bacterium]|nr:BON domain-containing protein [Acidobacteriota bacterium]